MTQEKTLLGCAISPGFGCGRCHIYRDILSFESAPYLISGNDVERELTRLDEALGTVQSNIEETVGVLPDNNAGKCLSGILLAQHAILADKNLRSDLRHEMTTELLNAEEIVKTVFRRLEHRLRSMKYSLFSERGDDIADLAKRVLQELSGVRVQALRKLPKGSVLVAERLLPSDTVYLSRDNVSAVLVEAGGPTCHAAILAREMGLPAVSSLDNVCQVIKTGDLVLVDGVSGQVVLYPTPEAKDTFEKKRGSYEKIQAAAKSKCQEPAVTKDKTTIKVAANIGCYEDALLASENGAEGVGLYRLEHVYLRRNSLPTAEEVLSVLKQAVLPLREQELTIRLLDVGADKELDFLEYPVEQNPVVGRRGVRFLFDQPDVLESQLVALLELSKDHNVRILVPMVTIESDIVKVRGLAEKLAGKMGIGEIPPIGAMIETPAAALCVRDIARHCDFLSVGSNDLTQYTMAAGRENLAVSEYYLDSHPALIRLLRIIVDESGEMDISVCGSLGSKTDSIGKLIEVGIRKLSVAPPAIPIVKETIRQFSCN